MHIFRKELNLFFSSLIGYIVITVFLTVTGLFLWILPDVNVFDFGYASLEEMFQVAPWIFMFLIPAITMRTYAEETSSGTIEILATKPLSDGRIVMEKYLASLVLVLFALLPTLLYFYTVYMLASPAGNVDTGATLGSYLGLIFLAGAYAAIGNFASSLTKNQIVSFILAVLLCFIFFALLEWLRGFTLTSGIDPMLEALSMKSHYQSLSRGVLDTRDAAYFLSIIALFLVFTKTIIESRKW